MDILDFFLDRTCANLPRWHTKPIIGAAETADAHHFWTAWLAGVLARNLIRHGHKVDLIKIYETGLTHDKAEEVTGDIPGSFKRLRPDARQVIHDWELAATPSLFGGLWPEERQHFISRIENYLTQESLERQIVKFADVLTAFSFADDQIKIGNQRLLRTRKDVAEELLERRVEFQWTDSIEGMDRVSRYAHEIVVDWNMAHGGRR